MRPFSTILLALAITSGPDVSSASASQQATPHRNGDRVVSQTGRLGPFGTFWAADQVAELLRARGYSTSIWHEYGAGWYIDYE